MRAVPGISRSTTACTVRLGRQQIDARFERFMLARPRGS
jgi:hypothetical protein